MRTFAYLRVSTDLQDNDNQLSEIEKAGFVIEPHRIFRDEVSGSVKAQDRAGFSALLNKVEKGDSVVITKIDRLGRTSSDVLQTVKNFENMGVALVCIQLKSTDLTSASGKLLLAMLTAIAEMERDLISERTKVALAKKKQDGVKLGRPAALSANQKKELQLLSQNEGFTVSAAAKQYSVSRASVLRAIGKI